MARCGCAGAGGSVGVADTPTLDLSLLAGVISGNVKLDAGAGNILQSVAGGLRLDCADIQACVSVGNVGVSDSAGIDFTTSGSGDPGDPRIISGDLKPVWYQTAPVIFTRNLAGAADVYEQVTELPALTLPVAGLYIVAMDVCGVATITGTTAALGASVSAQLRRDGVLVPNTETRISAVSQGVASTAEPALGVTATGTAIDAVQSDGTTQLTVWASRNVGGASTAAILSNAVGRTRITAWRIGV